MSSLTLSQRLLVVSMAAAAPMIGVLVHNAVDLRAEREQELHVQAARTSALVALEMQQVVSGVEGVLLTVAAASVARQGETEQCSQFLTRIVASVPKLNSIGVVDDRGVVRCSSVPAAVGIDVSDRPYIAAVRAGAALVVGEYTEGRASGTSVLPIATPLRSSDGQAWAVVATLNLAWLGAELRTRLLPEGGAVTIADRNGVILAREPLPERFVGTAIPAAFQHLVRADAPGTLELTSQDGTRRVIGYVPPAAPPAVGLYVSTGLSTEAAYAAIDRLTLTGALVSALSLAAALSLSLYTGAAFISRPSRKLLATIDAWRSDDVSARTGMTAADGEFGRIGQAIDGYMDELSDARAQRRRLENQRATLLAELDHRVKNLLGMVQALARQSFPNEARSGDFDVFMRRLGAMGDAHALLIRGDWQAADVGDLVAVAIAPFIHPGRDQFQVSGGRQPISGRAAVALAMALHELCTNAVKYGALQSEAGRVWIDWITAVDADGAAIFVLTWRETGGPPVAAPARGGFGTRMISRVLAQQINGDVQLSHDPAGVVCRIAAKLADLAPPQGHDAEAASRLCADAR